MNRKLGLIFLVAIVGGPLIWGIGEARRLVAPMLNPFVGSIVALFLLVGTIVLVFVAARWLKRRAGFMPEDWFWAAFLGWALGAVYYFVTGALSTIDIQMHDTYFVISRFHICLWLAVPFGVFGVIYHYNRRMVRVLGMIHFWMTFLSAPLFIWAVRLATILATPWPEAMPRRYMDYSNWVSFDQYGGFERMFLWLLAPGVLAQLVFLVNVVYSMVGGRKSAE